MGWLFSTNWTRKTLVEHLISGNGVKTIKSCSVGNNLWCVHEFQDKEDKPVRWACLYLIKGPAYGNKNDKYGWGYKDVDESMGPCEINFPYTWLDLLSPIESEYANDWRALVKARGEKCKSMTIGSKWKWGDQILQITKRRSPTSFYADSARGQYRVSLSNLLRMEKQNAEII